MNELETNKVNMITKMNELEDALYSLNDLMFKQKQVKKIKNINDQLNGIRKKITNERKSFVDQLQILRNEIVALAQSVDDQKKERENMDEWLEKCLQDISSRDNKTIQECDEELKTSIVESSGETMNEMDNFSKLSKSFFAISDKRNTQDRTDVLRHLPRLRQAVEDEVRSERYFLSELERILRGHVDELKRALTKEKKAFADVDLQSEKTFNIFIKEANNFLQEEYTERIEIEAKLTELWKTLNIAKTM